MKIYQQHLFASDYTGGLHVIDIQNPAAPVEICVVDSVTKAYDLVLEGSHAYLASREFGLQIVDIGDPQHPVLASRLGLAGATMSVAVSGSYAYMLNYVESIGCRVMTIRIASPTAPEVTDSLLLQFDATGMALYGAHLYIAGMTAGSVVSLADSAHPSLAVENVAALAGRDITVAGALAYLARGNNGWMIVEMANPLCARDSLQFGRGPRSRDALIAPPRGHMSTSAANSRRWDGSRFRPITSAIPPIPHSRPKRR